MLDLFSGGSVRGATYGHDGDAASVEDVLAKGLRLAEVSPVHLAVRGIADAGSVRCEWRGVARTPEQREAAIRFWLDLDDDDLLPSPAEAERRFVTELKRINAVYPTTLISNFRAIASGGLSTGYTFLTCYADYAVQEYLLGSGDTGASNELSVAYDRMGESRSYDTYKLAHEGGEFGGEALMTEGEYADWRSQIVSDVELVLGIVLEGRESVVFLAPMGAHNAIAVEAWQAVAQWDLQTGDEGTVNAVRYGASPRDSEHTQTLANLESRITAATAPEGGASGGSSEATPTRIASVRGLTKYYRDIGAYGDITPDDGSTATFTPAQPPATYTCASGNAITNPGSNRPLVHDCQALLGGKDTLKGTGDLDWSATTAIGSWEGITTGGTPTRVTKVVLPSESLSGSIPPELGRLFELTHLNLSSNSLTGDIPGELGWLHNLQELRLSGNSLTGCIPLSLRSVTTNDLSSLNLPYCQPPAPGAPTAGTTSLTSISLSWTAAANTSKYRVEYREGTAGSWTVDDEGITTTSHTVDGLRCGTEHQFRLSAYGSGTTYAAAWSDPSKALTASTGACVSPVFDEDSYAFSVRENAAVGTDVGAVSATDPNDDTLTYTIASGDKDGQFAIGTATGAITVAAALDHETTPTYTLTVEASDGTNDVSVSVEITVRKVNRPPVFPSEGFSFSVNESVGSYGSVGYAVATDPEGDAVTYAITGGNSGNQFTIDANLGLILVFRPLDFDARSSYTLTVKATDARGNTSFTAVTIAVVQTAQNPPPAPMGLTTSLEDVGNLIVTWNKVANASMYRLRHRTDSNAEWTTSAAATSTSRTLSSVTCGATYELQVQAQGDGVSYTAEWSDPSESISRAAPLCPVPTFGETSYDLTVPENAPVGTVVGTVAATHPDQTKLTYSITAGNDDGKFAIGAGGVITAVGALDYEATAAYALTVQATHPRGQSGTAAVAVTVADVNEAPSFDPGEYTFTVAEDAAVGASLGSLSVTDPDEDTLTYSITTGDDDGRFSVDSSGALSVAKALDHETTPSYTLTVEATDAGGLSDTAAVSIEITDVNEAPAFDSEEYTFTVPENSATGDSVGTVVAADPDDGDSDTLTYGISGDAFAIDTSGAITVDAALDHETTESYSVTVTVEDESGLSDTAAVAVTVTDVNETPSFDTAAYTFTVAEDAAVGASLGSLSVTDPDEDTLTYNITTGDDDGRFSVDSSGALSVAKALDHETTPSYTLTVEATDPGGLSDTAAISIEITDVNEAPAFDSEEYTFMVAENSATGDSVGTVAAADPDDGDTLTYSISGEALAIDAAGAITVDAALDHETTESYSVTVTVEDESGLLDTAAVAVTVTDVNETPSFDTAAYTFTVAENAVLGELLGTVSATDPDEDDTLAYSIDGEDFTISTGGAVTVARTLDYETAKSYSLTATVEDQDGASGTANVSITVTDVDETPAFDAEKYSFTVAEDAAVGTVVGTLTASDANERQGETLTYSVEGDAALTIDASTGALKVASALDYETDLTHELTVTVTDETDLTDTATVSIRVRDVTEVMPPVPGGLEADLKIREGRIDLSWNAVEGADQYRIQYRIDGSAGKWTNLEAQTGTSQRFTPEGGLKCGVSHEFRVQAHGDGETHPARWGSRSTSVAANIWGCSAPKAPTGLTATTANGSVVLSWTAPAGSDVTAYQILRRRPGIESGLLVLVENTGGTGTTYTDSSVEAGTRYIYRVKAINRTISGPNSNRVEVRIPR